MPISRSAQCDNVSRSAGPNKRSRLGCAPPLCKSSILRTSAAATQTLNDNCAPDPPMPALLYGIVEEEEESVVFGDHPSDKSGKNQHNSSERAKDYVIGGYAAPSDHSHFDVAYASNGSNGKYNYVQLAPRSANTGSIDLRYASRQETAALPATNGHNSYYNGSARAVAEQPRKTFFTRAPFDCAGGVSRARDSTAAAAADRTLRQLDGNQQNGLFPRNSGSDDSRECELAGGLFVEAASNGCPGCRSVENCADFHPDGHLDLAILRMSKNKLDISIQCVKAEANEEDEDVVEIFPCKDQPAADVTEKGWLYGEVNGRAGIFPCEYVVPLSRNELAELTKQENRYYDHSSPTAGVSHAANNGHHRHHQHQQQQQQQSQQRDHHQEMSSSAVTSEIRTAANSATYTTSSSRFVTSESQEAGRGTREILDTSAHWTAEARADFPDDKSDVSQMTTVNDGKHSLLQFALIHFRQSLDKYEMLRTADGSIRGSLKMIESLKSKKKKKGKDSDWTWKEQVEMVKYTKSPIQASLLRLESPEMNKLALECFMAIMRFMGDYPIATDQSDVDCVYTVLINCHKHPALRDEVYCQIMKQTTNNKSPKPDSCQRGWRLFSIIAAYFQSSDILRPYLLKYLETAAYDKRRAYHGTAMVCLQNLRKTFKCGGRKNVPSFEEIAAISAGRNSKRQIYRLPGGTERVINTKSTSVVLDIIEEICAILNVRNQHEMEEFSLYCIVEGDTFTMPLAREEYILDVTTELQRNQQVFYLIFCRSVWYYPLRLDNQLYIEVVFNQIAPDYLEGLLLVMPNGQLQQDVIFDLSRVAALLHRAAQMDNVPTLKETKYLLPKPVLTVRDIKPPQWVNMVQGSWKEVERLNPTDAKAQVLEILQKWPLFGSSFFAVKKIMDKEKGDYILALNRNGVHFMDVIAHETLQRYPFSEVISTRKVRAEDGTLYLDMKCGNLMVQKITRIQTDQAHEISRLIRQYITIEQRNRGLIQGEPPKESTLPR